MTDTANKNYTADKKDLSPREVYEARMEEWEEVEDLVIGYQKQFDENADAKTKEASQNAADELIRRFQPLFKKYLILIKSGQINWEDKEMKLFISSFMDDERLIKALKRPKQKANFRKEIYQKFNFVKETYGAADEMEITTDLQMLFLKLAKRYKQLGRSFCGYLYNCYRFEVLRHITAYIKNPINIPYRHIEYEDYIKYEEEPSVETNYEDSFYENAMGIPDHTWISGLNCSEIFNVLTPMERKLIVKYYLEDWNDRQISEVFSIHINTVNQKRRNAVRKLAKAYGISARDIKRNRKSGKKAIMPAY